MQFRAVGRIRLAAGAAPGPDRRRECLPAAREPRLHGPRRIRRQHPEPAAGDGIRVPVPVDRPGRGERPDRAHRAGEDAQRAAAVHRKGARCMSTRRTIRARAMEPSFTSLLAGLLRRRTGRLERRLGAAGTAGRHDPGACRTLQARATELRGPDDDAVRRHDVADPEGHAERSRSRSRRPATAR